MVSTEVVGAVSSGLSCWCKESDQMLGKKEQSLELLSSGEEKRGLSVGDVITSSVAAVTACGI